MDQDKDERFANVHKNPIYRRVPKKEKRVNIDKRFQSMFHDKSFKLKYKVDKRGRPLYNTTTDENLKRYYNIEEDDDDEAEKSSENEEDDENSQKSEESENKSESSSSDEDEEDNKVHEESSDSKPGFSKNAKIKISEKTKKKLRSEKIDYARGEGDFLSDEESSSDESESDADDNSVANSDLMHEWGEMDKDAVSIEESTSRLAVCNMDWDRVRAEDLMVLLNSFVPSGSSIKSVTIYPSEYGKERLAEEEIKGPRELTGVKTEVKDENIDDTWPSNSGEGDNDEEDEGKFYNMEKLRKYQLNRLKYYYAVVEFDSKETAETVYKECDGMEYESSASRLDLRFIPEDMTFDDEPKDVCTNMPEQGKYKPKFFTTTALQQMQVNLTWDETDPNRKELTEKIYNSKGEVDDDDIKAYLASSDSEEDEMDIKQEDQSSDNSSDDENHKDTKDAISKYRALLESIEDNEKQKKEKDVEMEISWGVGLKEKTEKLVQSKLEEEEKKNKTPWEEMLEKQKEKKKRKKYEKKKQNKNGQTSDDSDADSEENESSETDESDEEEVQNQPFSDDDIDVDMNDDFFKEEMRNNEVFMNSKQMNNKKKRKKGDDDKKLKDGKAKEKSDALELLLMDENDHKRHFSLKKIMEEENMSDKKKKKKKRKLNDDTGDSEKYQDDFQINVDDERFSALFTSHKYNVDPSDPNYKKTKAMETIIMEKQKRRIGDTEKSNKEDSLSSKETEKPSEQPAKKSGDVSYLIKSIKRNAKNFTGKKASAFNRKK